MHPECPNCRSAIPRYRLFITTAWGRFPCRNCGSLLGVNLRRRFLGVGLCMFLGFAWVMVLRGAAVAVSVVPPVVFFLGILVYVFFFDRAVVHERTGFRCRRCGYDLQGQADSRCPECGTTFDLSGKPKLDPDGDEHKRQSSLARTVTFLVMAALLLAVTFGLVAYTRFAGGRRAAPGIYANTSHNPGEQTGTLAKHMERIHSAARAYRRDYSEWPASIDPLVGVSLPSGYKMPTELAYRPPPALPPTSSDLRPTSSGSSLTSSDRLPASDPLLDWVLVVSEAVDYDRDGNRLAEPHRLILRLGGKMELLPADAVNKLLASQEDEQVRSPAPSPEATGGD